MQDVAQFAAKLYARQVQLAHFVIQHGARQYAPGQADGDQHFDGFQIVGVHVDVRCEAVGAEQVEHYFAGEGLAAGKNSGPVAQVVQADAGLLAERMAGSHDKYQLVLPDMHAADRLHLLRRQGNQGQLAASVQHVLIGHFGVQKTDVEHYIGVVAGVAAQYRWQPAQADMVTGGQTEAAADVFIEVVQRLPGVFQFVEDAVGAWQQGFAGLGQAHIAAQPVKQAGAGLFSQCRQALADGWLGDVQLVTGKRKTAQFGNGYKGVEAGQIHAGIPLWNAMDKILPLEL